MKHGIDITDYDNFVDIIVFAERMEQRIAVLEVDLSAALDEVERCHNLAGVDATYENFFHILEHCPARVRELLEKRKP